MWRMNWKCAIIDHSDSVFAFLSNDISPVMNVFLVISVTCGIDQTSIQISAFDILYFIF